MAAIKVLGLSILVLALASDLALAISIRKKRNDSPASNRLPFCEANSICGVVQANSRGLTAYPLCSCPDALDECPLIWDSGDGKSVNQGSTQYKHCGTAPKHLSPCLPGETAYTMKIITPFAAADDESTMKISHNIHCKCPDNYQHVPNGEDSELIPFVGEAKSYLLACAPYPTCGNEDACKTLSETKTEFLESKACRCPVGSHCPVVGNRKAKAFEFGKGRLTQLFCQ